MFSPSFFYRSCRTDFITISTVQTIFLMNDHRFHTNINTSLRTFAVTELAANAAIRHKISCLSFRCFSKCKTFSINRLFDRSNRSPFPSSSRNTVKCSSGRSIWINFIHIWIFSNKRGSSVPSSLTFPPRKPPRQHGIFAFHAGQARYSFFFRRS